MTDQEYNALILYFRRMSEDDLLKEYVTKLSTQNSPKHEEWRYFYLLKCEVEERKLLENIDNQGRIKSEKTITKEAITWCVNRYRKLIEINDKNISKRCIAIEAYNKFFPTLPKSKRSKKIDSIRVAYLKKVPHKKRYGTRRKSSIVVP